jgi:alpha-galactosidase
MLVVGWVGWGPNIHPTRLSASEQYTHISLWSLLSAPLLLGNDLTKLDDFTLNLLTNAEVIDIDQDPLGIQAAKILEDGDIQIWAKDLEDGSKAVGIFNLGETVATTTLNWNDIGISGNKMVRDVWRQKDLGEFKDSFDTKILSHGVTLVKISDVTE